MANNTKNKGVNLHDHLFAQLENLAEVKEEQIQVELQRTKGMCDIADKLISLADLQLKAAQIQSDSLLKDTEMPRLLVN